MSRAIAVAAANWKPRKRGKVYCSPACGAGCTIAAHRKAVAAGKRLVKRLGPLWVVRVWENMGWHFELTIAGAIFLDEYPVWISGRKVKNYTARLLHSAEYHTGGHATPEAALNALDKLLVRGASELINARRVLARSRR